MPPYLADGSGMINTLHICKVLQTFATTSFNFVFSISKHNIGSWVVGFWSNLLSYSSHGFTNSPSQFRILTNFRASLVGFFVTSHTISDRLRNSWNSKFGIGNIYTYQEKKFIGILDNRMTSKKHGLKISYILQFLMALKWHFWSFYGHSTKPL